MPGVPNQRCWPKDAMDELLAAIFGRRTPASVLGHRRVRMARRWLWF